jgi:hypothetical protein
MEYMLLSLYIVEFALGKKTDSGFPDSSHQEVARELQTGFPEARHLLDYDTVKTKLTVSYKQDSRTFLAFKAAKVFRWDERNSEIIASDEDWNHFLVVSCIFWIP